MARKIILRRVKNVWRIENSDGHIISERMWARRHQAVEWCNIFLSSFQELFHIEVIDGDSDSRRQTDDKKT